MCVLWAEARKDLSPQTETPHFLHCFFPLPTTLTAVICVSVDSPVYSPLLPKAHHVLGGANIDLPEITVGLSRARARKLNLLFRASIKPGHFIGSLSFWKPPIFHGVSS